MAKSTHTLQNNESCTNMDSSQQYLCDLVMWLAFIDFERTLRSVSSNVVLPGCTSWCLTDGAAFLQFQ